MANEPTGFNFSLSWGLMEWLITALASAVIAVAGWIWQLGIKVTALDDKVSNLTVKSQELKEEIKELEKKVEDRYGEMELGRQQLKIELISRIADIPTRGFIEAQLNNQTARIDKLMEQRLRQ